MRSKWHYLKDPAISMRKAGVSIRTIEHKLGIPRSTLSGWFKPVVLTEAQRTRLMKNGKDGWAKARILSAKRHRELKLQRLRAAKLSATKTLDRIEITDEILEMAFAMLYWGEGSKKDVTSLGCSDPKMLRFTILAFKRVYGVTTEDLRCDLHLRMDQNGEKLKVYWANELGLPISCFKYAAYDKRTAGRATYDCYKGVCLLNVGRVEIQRRLIYLYNLFYDKVERQNMGA